MVASSLFRKILGVGVGHPGGAVVVSVAALVAALVQWDHVATHGAQVTIAGAIAFDGFGVFIQIAVSIAMLLTALVGDGYLRREGVEGPEFHVLAMLSASGAMIMGAANDLIVIFLGLEILSIALYVLAAFNPKRAESGEAALKYFVLGAFSSAVFLYGIALVYGATGSTNLPQIADYLSRNVLASNGVLLAGLALLLVGFGFKIAAVPFHLWTPDVYQGSPVPGHRVHGRGGQGRRLRRAAAGVRVVLRHRAHRLAADRLGSGHPHPGARGGGGPGPARHQADDGLLVHQPRRLHPARGAGGHHPGRVGVALLPLHLHLHGHRDASP